MKKLLMSLLFPVFGIVLFGQETGSLQVTIIDKQTGQTLPGATITIKGTNLSVVANSQGYYIIPKINPGEFLIAISFVGYEISEVPVKITAGNPSVINVELNIDSRLGNAVVVSASRRAEKITNAPASIRVIGAKELDDFSGSNVFQLASYQQGVEYVRTGIDYVALNARGFNKAANSKVLQIVDGRNTTTTATGNLPMYNYSTLNKIDVERMEIVLGPQAALYGPNAHNAVFNIIMKDPRKYQGTTVEISAGNRYQIATRLRHAIKVNNKWAYKLTGEYLAGKEFIFYDSVYAGGTSQSGPPVVIPERNVDFDFHRIRGEAHLYYSMTPGIDLIISAGKSDNYSLGVSNIGRNQVRGISPSFLQARIVHSNFFATIYNTWGILGTSYAIYPYTREYWNRTHSNPPSSPDSAEMHAMRSSRTLEKNQRLNAEAQYNYFFKKAGLHLVAGLSYQKEKPNSYGTTLVDKERRIFVTQWGGVAQLEKALPWDLRFLGALRLDNHSNLGNLFSPKLALVKNIHNNNFRFTWAKAYAVPSVFFQYSNSNGLTFGNGPGVKFIPNGSTLNDESIVSTNPLMPEQIQTWEVGFKGILTKRIYCDLNLYYGVSENFLSPPFQVDGRILSVGDIPVTPTFPGQVDNNGFLKDARFNTYFNYGSVRLYGLDVEFNYSCNKHVNLKLRYSWFGSDITGDNLKNDANSDSVVTKEESNLNAPGHKGVAILNLENLCRQKMFLSLIARFTQRYDFYSGNLIGTEAGEGRRGIVYRNNLPPLNKNFDWGPLGGFVVIDINAGYKLNEMMKLNLNITNLFNVKQREFVSSPFIGRLIVFELKVHVPNVKRKIRLS